MLHWSWKTHLVWLSGQLERRKQGHSLTLDLSRSRSKAVTISAACKPATTVSCASILVKSRSLNESRGQASYRRQNWKERTAILPPRWKPRSLLPQVPDRCVDCVHVPWCTTRRPSRVITRSTTLRLPRNNFSQEPWKRCAVLFLLGGGGGGTFPPPPRYTSWNISRTPWATDLKLSENLNVN